MRRRHHELLSCGQCRFGGQGEGCFVDKRLGSVSVAVGVAEVLQSPQGGASPLLLLTLIGAQKWELGRVRCGVAAQRSARTQHDCPRSW